MRRGQTMKPVSMWVIFGVNLFIVLCTGAIAQPPVNPSSAVTLTFGDFSGTLSAPFLKSGFTGPSPLTGDPPLGLTTQKASVMPRIPSGNIQGTLQLYQPTIGAQPEPPEVFNVDLIP